MPGRCAGCASVGKPTEEQALGTIPYFGRASAADREASGARDQTGRIHVQGQQGETQWRTEEWIGQTDVCKSRPNISDDGIPCGLGLYTKIINRAYACSLFS
ncbi:hypothetical protein K0M31_001672 [Melipona bicolor]|uniref:Uncharacterized protein n=1 Tax=Melipona bicolor TaxID=60889 RepID=A0AA40KYD1_9HYME|nr:hypothetical protein K0M31_001672 [Melipona bicolor]